MLQTNYSQRPTSDENYQHIASHVDIDQNSLIYAGFDELTFIEYFAFYTKQSSNFRTTSKHDNIHTDPLPKEHEKELIVDTREGHTLPFISEHALRKSGYKMRRIKARIIRTRRYDENNNPENYYREHLMLYTSWRDEDELLYQNDTHYSTYKEAYEARKEDIENIKRNFDQHSKEINDALDQNAEISKNEDNDDNDLQFLAPSTETINEDDLEFLRQQEL